MARKGLQNYLMVMRKMIKHLGTSSELMWFGMRMAEELENHIKEKTSLREVDCEEVKRLVIREIRLRLDKIEELNVEDTDDLQRIAKQCVHIANYSMMLFLRSKYNV